MPKDIEDVEKLINEIKEYIGNNRKSIFSRFKNNRIIKLLNQYDRGLKEKILIETSTYFQHRRNIPNGKYYTSLIEGMLNDESDVIELIGKDENRNCRLIFLPILAYKSEEEYMKYALHELMHISKEKIEDNPSDCKYIKTDFGNGYIFSAECLTNKN